MESYEKRFLQFLKYAYFIKDEKVNIQRSLNGLPDSYKDNIQYDRSKTLKESIWKGKHIYYQNENKAPYENEWKYFKKKDNQD